jgi:hypothetical protein
LRHLKNFAKAIVSFICSHICPENSPSMFVVLGGLVVCQCRSADPG